MSPSASRSGRGSRMRCSSAVPSPVEGVNLHLVSASVVTRPESDSATATIADGPRWPSRTCLPGPVSRRSSPAMRGRAALLPRAAAYYGDIRLAFVHHSVNANGYSSAQVPAMLRSIYYFHTYVRGWNDIGYNFAVDAYGRIWEARAGGIDQPVVGAQAGGYNFESFGAVLLGDFSATLPTAAARPVARAPDRLEARPPRRSRERPRDRRGRSLGCSLHAIPAATARLAAASRRPPRWLHDGLPRQRHVRQRHAGPAIFGRPAGRGPAARPHARGRARKGVRTCPFRRTR